MFGCFQWPCSGCWGGGVAGGQQGGGTWSPAAATPCFPALPNGLIPGQGSSQPRAALRVVQGAAEQIADCRLQISFPSARPSCLSPSESAAAAQGGSGSRWEFAHPGWDQTAPAAAQHGAHTSAGHTECGIAECLGCRDLKSHPVTFPPPSLALDTPRDGESATTLSSSCDFSMSQ